MVSEAGEKGEGMRFSHCICHMMTGFGLQLDPTGRLIPSHNDRNVQLSPTDSVFQKHPKVALLKAEKPPAKTSRTIGLTARKKRSWHKSISGGGPFTIKGRDGVNHARRTG